MWKCATVSSSTNQPVMLINHAKSRRHHAGLGALLFVIGMLLVGLFQVNTSRRGDPDERQRIAATLMAWGLAGDGLTVRFDTKQIDQHIAILPSPISEERVRTAGWLASRGLRRA